MSIKKTLWLILLVFTAACAADQPGEVVQTASMTPSSEPAVLQSTTPTYLPPTPSFTPTPSPSPTIQVATATPTPLERLTFSSAVVEYVPSGFGLAKISFVNSDGTGLEFPALFEPYHQDADRVVIGQNLAWSPDGRFLVFDGSDTFGFCDSDGTDCFTTNYGTYIADYSQSAILQHIEGTLMNASWSPDSQHLVLSLGGKTEGRRLIGDLYILDVSNGRLEQLTSSPSSHLYPSWSPDGQWIAFVRFDPDIPGCGSLPIININYENCNQASLYRIRPDGSDLQLLFEPIFIWRDAMRGYKFSNNVPAWSPDSRWLAFLTRYENGLHDDSDIAIVNIETGEWRLVVSGYGATTSPAWSPDGQKLAFASGWAAANMDIYLWDMIENSIVNLTGTTTSGYNPVWSVSGAHIAFISDGKLWIMNADGTNKVLIDDEYQYVLGRPAWQPGVQP